VETHILLILVACTFRFLNKRSLSRKGDYPKYMPLILLKWVVRMWRMEVVLDFEKGDMNKYAYIGNRWQTLK
jgi:hypothetical protein